MPTPLHRLIQSLDDKRRLLLDELGRLSLEALQARLQAETWSILEILEHVVVAERVILQGLPAQTDLVERPRSLQHRVRYPLVLLVLKLAIPVKVPSRRMVPTGHRSLADLRDEWDEHLRWFRVFETDQEAGAHRKPFFVHPVAGPITLVQALRMDLLHLGIHTRQISKILEHQTRQTA